MTQRIRTHPGANLKDCLEAEGWSTSSRPVWVSAEIPPSRLLNGHCGISPAVALALERIGWSNAEFWMRRQASYDLSKARRQVDAAQTF